MEDSNPTGNTSGSGSASSKSLDPGRKYGKQDPTNRNNFFCNFCGVRTTGGVFRLKQHLVGGHRNTLGCQRVPEHIKKEIQDYMDLKKASKEAYDMSKRLPQSYFDEEDDDDECVEMPKGGKFTSGGSKGSNSMPSKRSKTKGPIDMFFTPNPADVVKARKEGKDQGRQKTLNEMCRKDLRNKVCRDIARFFYDGAIPFNLLTLDSFQVMCESIGQFGPGLKPPSMYEARIPLLKKEVEDTEKAMVENKKEWAQKGCLILSDGWRDSTVQKDIINFLVNSPKGSVFIRSMDVSDVVKDANLLFKILDDLVEEIGEENVVQVVTDNASNYVKAGKNSSLKVLNDLN